MEIIVLLNLSDLIREGRKEKIIKNHINGAWIEEPLDKKRAEAISF